MIFNKVFFNNAAKRKLSAISIIKKISIIPTHVVAVYIISKLIGGKYLTVIKAGMRSWEIESEFSSDMGEDGITFSINGNDGTFWQFN